MASERMCCYLLLLGFTGTALAATIDLDNKEQGKRNLDFAFLNARKARALSSSSCKGRFKWFGGSNKCEECREGCSHEELDEHRMNDAQILEFMRAYNCEYKANCPQGTYCMYGSNPDFSHNKKLIVKCNRHGGWSDWDSWSTCTKSCEGGTRTRTRSCTNPTKLNDGQNCYGDAKVTQTCNNQLCPVNGGWSGYSDWTTCTASCGGGTQSRTRQCNKPTPANGGKNCDGDVSESRQCNTDACPVDGGWSDWSEFTECSKKCGGGLKSHTRTCTNPGPANGGAHCEGPANLAVDCNEQPCPINGGWSLWSDWESCSVSCGMGTQNRIRTCSTPTPAFGGLNCTGDTSEKRDCDEAPCESSDLVAGLTASCVESESACKLNYLEFANRLTRGQKAAPAGFQSSIEKCQEICSQLWNCSGYYWEGGSEGVNCSLKIDEYDAIDRVDYYQRTDWKANSVSVFMKYINFHAEGAVGLLDTTTVDGCAEVCTSKQECRAFDYDRSDRPWRNTRCWIHQNEIQNDIQAAGNFYLKQPCPVNNIE